MEDKMIKFCIATLFVFGFAILLRLAIYNWMKGRYFDFSMFVGFAIYQATYIVKVAMS